MRDVGDGSVGRFGQAGVQLVKNVQLGIRCNAAQSHRV
eukprot:gene19391-biopygen14561